MGLIQTSLEVALDFIALTDEYQSDGDGDNNDNGSPDKAP
ncbi:dihydrolipoamide dehydrogenase [Crocosphaera chwakensis CCY0110]|uniref:Dihydrolipoamide dehydrogenase n=1 Tax=Crocosphaera chwakensis CCY0110 TaxID=391612 RepID=A3IMY4_9CHRO|nr:dihydrolipoamide dehydrogenase [Crocosphaera chwakensis CCY0110]